MSEIERDPFDVIGRIPKGRAYQWVALPDDSNPGLARLYRQCLNAGWRAVPARRHRKMPRMRQRIVHEGMVLMENDAARVASLRESEIAAARAQHDSALATPKKEGGHVTILSPDKLEYTQTTWGGYVIPEGGFKEAIVETSLPLRLPPAQVEAAAICGLTVEEYARRFLLLALRGDGPEVLIPTYERNAFEFRSLIVKRN